MLATRQRRQAVAREQEMQSARADPCRSDKAYGSHAVRRRSNPRSNGARPRTSGCCRIGGRNDSTLKVSPSCQVLSARSHTFTVRGSTTVRVRPPSLRRARRIVTERWRWGGFFSGTEGFRAHLKGRKRPASATTVHSVEVSLGSSSELRFPPQRF